MKGIKVAIVGCGFMGRMHANVYKGLEQVEIVAAIDHNDERLSEYAVKFGCTGTKDFSEGIDGADVVDICLPTHQHAETTVAAARAGKHVLCEKPMALSLDEADHMIAACKEAGVQLMIGHCIRFWPEYSLLKTIKDEGRLGRLLSINLTRYGAFPYWASDNWMADESKAGGGALDMHIHDTDYALYLLGKPDSINSFGSIDERGVGQIFTTMTFGEVVAHLEGGWNLPGSAPFKMAFRAIFEDGVVIMDGGPMTIYQGNRAPISPEFPKMEAAGGGNLSDLGGYYHEIAYFLEAVRTGRPLEIVTPETSRASLETTLEEIRQVKERQRRER